MRASRCDFTPGRIYRVPRARRQLPRFTGRALGRLPCELRCRSFDGREPRGGLRAIDRPAAVSDRPTRRREARPAPRWGRPSWEALRTLAREDLRWCGAAGRRQRFVPSAGDSSEGERRRRRRAMKCFHRRLLFLLVVGEGSRLRPRTDRGGEPACREAPLSSREGIPRRSPAVGARTTDPARFSLGMRCEGRYPALRHRGERA